MGENMENMGIMGNMGVVGALQLYLLLPSSSESKKI